MDDLQTNPNLISRSTVEDKVNGDRATAAEVEQFIQDFLTRLRSESEKNQLQLTQDLADKGEVGLLGLMRILQERRAARLVGERSLLPTVLEGKVYQLLVAANTTETREFLQAQFPQGLVEGRSRRHIDYQDLQTLLAQQNYLEADRLTMEKLCELAGETAQQRRWLYFTEVEQFPSEDLHTLNTLWNVFSEGKFGFAVQRELWLGTGKNWDKLWTLIGWKTGNTWTRYPTSFTWDLSAPRGHLPLNNQLRGVRVFASLLTHPAWTEPNPEA